MSVESMWNKIIELESDTSEHDLVIKTLEPMDPARKCYRQIGGPPQLRAAACLAWLTMLHAKPLRASLAKSSSRTTDCMVHGTGIKLLCCGVSVGVSARILRSAGCGLHTCITPHPNPSPLAHLQRPCAGR